MQDSQFDDAHRAAEAFMAANRCEDPKQAALLRQEAYRLVERIGLQRERQPKPEHGDEDRQLAWDDVLGAPGRSADRPAQGEEGGRSALQLPIG